MFSNRYFVKGTINLANHRNHLRASFWKPSLSWPHPKQDISSLYFQPKNESTHHKNYKNDVILRFWRVVLQGSIFECIRNHRSCYHVEWAFIEIILSRWCWLDGAEVSPFLANQRPSPGRFWFRSWSGIGLFKNLQSGSHPSFKSHTRRFSFGTVAITWQLCFKPVSY